MSWTLIRTLSPARWTAPSSTVPTDSSLPIWRRFFVVSRYSITEVREITLSEPMLARLVSSSSWMPSANIACAGSTLRLVNGSTAIEAERLASRRFPEVEVDRNAERDDQEPDDREVQLAAGHVRDRVLVRNLVGALQAFRRQLERPGERERQHESQHDQQDQDSEDPRRCAERRQEEGRSLKRDPGDDGVGDADLVDVPPAQLGEEGTHAADYRLIRGLSSVR